MIKQMLLIVIISCFFLTGCTGLKNIQDLTYIVAIGMDYDKEKQEYKVFLQGLNFANVAKQEGSRPVEPIPIYVATATGETLNLAVRDLYKKAEPPLFFGHVSTLLLSKNVVTQKFQEVIEEVGRNRSLRPTLRVVVTEEDISEVFNIKALFNYPAVYTVLFKKNSHEMAQDEIKPTTLMKFLRAYYEPMGVAKIPYVKIDKDSWKADKDFPILFFDGYAVFQQQQYMKELPFDDAVYVNWLLEKRVTLDQKIEKEGKLVAAVKFTSPKMKIKYEKGASSPIFSLDISANADLLEKLEDTPIEELEKLIEEEIKKRVTSLFEQSVEQKIDILNVGEQWYRKHPKEYQKLKKEKTFYLNNQSLKDVKVNVDIFHFNSYKYDLSKRSGIE